MVPSFVDLAPSLFGPGLTNVSRKTADEGKISERTLGTRPRQNEPRAFYELGRIYSGDLVRGINGPAKAAAMLTEQPENKPLALMWFNLAAAAGYEDAADEAEDLREDMTAPEILQANLRQKNWSAQACEWNDVYPGRKL